ncbi:putative ABC transport system permease protein [Mucilaginibacter sp. OK268]|uniref:ABC transporter permease n=1 Tax=Mucilaginibacter sp. OK268 TaxID=1881048 RepID=UPI000890B8EA|nr:ABC transporter permease [Mucilaginibacter sp. OK268]SDP19809.1 putative ABC transport system permease protein [Mucilaginibacter sp. OK268]
MIRNILLVTYRNLIKNKIYTFINVTGLALGMAAFILITAFVNFEKSFDRIHPDAPHIYRVESQFYRGHDLTDSWPTSTNGYAPAMKANFPEIASYARISWANSERVVKYNNTKYREAHVCFADSNFFSFFAYPLVKGDPLTVLKEVNTIVISQSAAKKYFGNADAIGKFLDVSTLGDKYHCMVTGVFKDVPANSTMQFNFLMSWATSSKFIQNFWYQHESYTFVKLNPGATIQAVEAKFPALAEQYKTGPSLKELKWAVKLIPLTDIHLNPAKPYEIEVKGNRFAVNFLNVIAFIILMIACINYINLATTKSVDRAREVGIRKVSGAHASQLILQFLTESFIINIVALFVAIILVLGARYGLLHYLYDSNTYGLLFNSALLLKVSAVFLGSILISGIYPAMVLARLKPIAVLKGRFAFSKSGILLRRGMVAFQFMASVLLIAGTFAVYRQIVYMSSQSTGVNINQTIVIKTPVNTSNYAQKVSSFKNTLLGFSGVKAVTLSGAVPGREVREFLANRRFGAPKSEERTYEMLKVDHDFMQAYGMQLIAGRAFDKSRPADSVGVVLNESAVKQFGFSSPEDAVGKKVWLETVESRPDEVIGVIKDYHQQSLQQKYTPVILFMDPALAWIPADYFSVKVSQNNMPQMVNNIKSTWNENFPESSFDFFFLDDFYNRQYNQETQFGHVFTLFSSLAIFIACIGLFGLTAYSAARRTKEIGVRKVLGASVQSIISLLTWDVVKLILVSSLFALPVAYIFINQWLNHYAFKVALTWWQFALPVFALVVIAIGTTFYLTFRAALTNPTSSLRNE